jgi:pimeloyl-ACP methyl ester carboxylesterase
MNKHDHPRTGLLERDSVRRSRRRMLKGPGAALAALVVLAVLGLVGAMGFGASGVALANQTEQTVAGEATTSKPSVVLVHGAWADGSSWNGVTARLQADGFTVYVPPNPLRGLSSDSAYVADFLTTVSGPIILVGHSYGGAVITNAAVGNPNVKALVFVDALVPDQGETLLQLTSAPPPPGQAGSCVAGDPSQVFNFVPYPGAPAGDVDLYIKPELFPACFANDLPASQAAVMAASQRPIAFSTLLQPSGPPAWETIPSWYLVGTLDKVIPPYAQIFMAQRANAQIVKVKASHPAMISHPDAAADLIEKAARKVAGGN